VLAALPGRAGGGRDRSPCRARGRDRSGEARRPKTTPRRTADGLRPEDAGTATTCGASRLAVAPSRCSGRRATARATSSTFPSTSLSAPAAACTPRPW
jgi:hypothetical protein